MTKVTYPIRFVPEPLEKQLGEVAYRELMQEIKDDEPLEDHGPTRKVMVVVDGYHVRSALQRRLGGDGPENLTDWIDRLGSWLADEFMTDDFGLEVHVRAWDAHLLRTGSGKAPHTKRDRTRARLVGRNGERYQGRYTTWLEVEWNFTDLKRVGDQFVQSGVDARIAADVIGMALDRPHAIFLVTGDNDFELAMQVVGAIGDAPKVAVLTMQPPGRGQERLLENVASTRWVVYPQHEGPNFARRL